MRSLLIVLPLCVALANNCLAQKWGATADEEFKLWVKQYDEFIHRFNFEKDPMGNKVLDSVHVVRFSNDRSVQLTRAESIMLLFDKIYYGQEEAKCKQFIEEVVQSKITLSFYDREWWVMHSAQLSYKGKPTEGVFTMWLEDHAPNGSKWVVAGFESPMLTTTKRTDIRKYIYPVANDTEFIKLDEAMTNRDYFHQSLPASHEPEPLTWLEAEVRNGNLSYGTKLPGTTDRYHLLQVPGWLVLLRYFNRNEHNNGWLIAEISKATDADKALYRKEVLGLKK